MSRFSAWQAMCITVIVGCLGLLTAELIFGHEEAPDPCFIVSDGVESVSYDARVMKMRSVFFDSHHRVVVQIHNPYPDYQYLEIYNQKSGQTTRVNDSAVLQNNNYTIAVCNNGGKKLAQTKLRVIRDNSV